MYEHLRAQYGDAYVISFPDGTDIPWRPLSYGEYVYYQDLKQESIVNYTIIEEEIFQKCVLNRAIRENIGNQKAGTISSTVQAIMSVSGPFSIDEFNNRLELNRQKAQHPLHYIPTLICRAFPGYTIEDVNNMDYRTMMLRLAQAEDSLMKAGIIQEQIQLYNTEEQEQAQQNRTPPAELKRAWEQAYNKSSKSKQEKSHPVEGEKRQKSPAAEKPTDIMNLLKDSMSPEAEDSYTSNSRLERKTVEDARWIYADLIEDLKNRGNK